MDLPDARDETDQGADAMTTTMMKNAIKPKGIAPVEDLRRVRHGRHDRMAAAGRREEFHRERDKMRHQPVHLICGGGTPSPSSWPEGATWPTKFST
jgi:hypothetical protein